MSEEPRLPRHKTVSDDEILDVARAIFQKDGHSVSTRDIAKQVGLSQAVLFQRFGSKEALFFKAMIPRSIDFEAVLKMVPGQGPKEYLLAVGARLLQHFREVIPAGLKLIAHPKFQPSQLGDAHEHAQSAELSRGLAVRLEELQKEGRVKAPEPEAAAYALLAITHNLAFHELIGVGASKAHSARAMEAMFEVVWSGMKPDEKK